MTVFVDRRDEEKQFTAWVKAEPVEGAAKRCALLVGVVGSGKTALCRRFEELCLRHTPERWYVQRAEVNRNESASAFLERLLFEVHYLVRGRPLPRGPNDQRLVRALVSIVPAVGPLLAALVHEDRRPAWARFIDYLAGLSGVLREPDDRFVLIVDPDLGMQGAQADEWLTIAGKLPRCVRLLIAQRPDDVMASESEARRRFVMIPAKGLVPDLDRDAIKLWYEREYASGRLLEVARGWPESTRWQLPVAAYERYRGYPVGHDAVLRLLSGDVMTDPVGAIGTWPTSLRELMDALFESLARQGENHLRLVLALQVFSVPIDKDMWAKVAGISTERLMHELADTKLTRFLSTQDAWYALFHPLFGERVEEELTNAPALRRELTEKAWQAVEPLLDVDRLRHVTPSSVELVAAVNIATRFSDSARLIHTIERVAEYKHQLGLLSSLEADAERLLAQGQANRRVRAAGLRLIGIVRKEHLELEEAELAHRGALAISRETEQPIEIAHECGNLGNVLFMRGDFRGALEMHTEALEIHRRLGDGEAVAWDLLNIGNVRCEAGGLEQADEAYAAVIEAGKALSVPKVVAGGLSNRAIVLRKRGDLAGAAEVVRQSIAIREGIGDRIGLAQDLNGLGNILVKRAELAGSGVVFLEFLNHAEASFRRALDINLESGRAGGVAAQRSGLGNVFGLRGEWESAEREHRAALEIYARSGHKVGVANQHSNLGLVLYHSNRLDDAEAEVQLALSMNREMVGRGREVVEATALLGSIRHRRGR